MLVFDTNLRDVGAGSYGVRKKPKTDTSAETKPAVPEPEAAPAAAVEATSDAVGYPDAGTSGPSGSTAVTEPAAEAAHRLGEQVTDLARQVAEWKDRALRAAADLENYRRRAMRERDDSAARAQGEVLARILEVVDDLARVAHLDPASTSAAALHEGMLAIERKFLRALEASSVQRVDPAGAPFDPNAHEAVTMMPAPGPEADGTVGMVLQPGYKLRGALLRPARVAVMRWTAPEPQAPPPPTPPADVVH